MVGWRDSIREPVKLTEGTTYIVFEDDGQPWTYDGKDGAIFKVKVANMVKTKDGKALEPKDFSEAKSLMTTSIGLLREIKKHSSLLGAIFAITRTGKMKDTKYTVTKL